jgi:hypothetical protein
MMLKIVLGINFNRENALHCSDLFNLELKIFSPALSIFLLRRMHTIDADARECAVFCIQIGSSVVVRCENWRFFSAESSI